MNTFLTACVHLFMRSKFYTRLRCGKFSRSAQFLEPTLNLLNLKGYS
jgi:hypothetical protein